MKRYTEKSTVAGEETRVIQVLRFESYTEAIETANNVGNDCGQVLTWTFTHTHNFAEAYKLATHGWKAGLEQIDATVNTLNITLKAKKLETYFDVIGNGGFDMGRVLSGEPENCLDWRESDIDIESTQGPIVKIIVNVVASSMVETNILQAKGAAVAALIDALESAGKRVELEAVFYINSTVDLNYTYKIFVPLKTTDHALQKDQLAFALIHPSFMRRMMFRCLSTISEMGMRDAKRSCGGFMGWPLHPLTDCNLFIGSTIGYESEWNSQSSIVDWIHKQLKKFGVEFEVE